MCADKNWPIVLIAPLSHKLYPVPKPDLIMDSTDKNGLAVKSRVILSQVQPLLKTALQERMGEISKEKWEEIIRRIFWHVRR